jgi:hypothetical protein
MKKRLLVASALLAVGGALVRRRHLLDAGESPDPEIEALRVRMQQARERLLAR